MALASDTNTLRRLLRHWGRTHGRRFPWRESGLYETAVAEVLLQKTRGDAIEPYWRAVIARYPTFEALSRARIVTLQRIVSPLGLGEQRARRLRAMARAELSGSGSVGLGPYGRAVVALTSGVAPTTSPVDGNVARVLSRLGGWSWERGEPRKKPEIRGLATQLVSTQPTEALETLYALVDLGALVCSPRSPSCSECPLRTRCAFGLEVSI